MSAFSGQRRHGRKAQDLHRQGQKRTQEHGCHSIRGSHGHPVHQRSLLRSTKTQNWLRRVSQCNHVAFAPRGHQKLIPCFFLCLWPAWQNKISAYRPVAPPEPASAGKCCPQGSHCDSPAYFLQGDCRICVADISQSLFGMWL